jgi:hypothetical protein
MAGRVKADCGADSMEHSYSLTHLIPIGLWLMVIGWHLGSARVHLRRVGEKEFGRVGVFRMLKRAGWRRRSSSIRARIVPKSSAARSRVTFSPRGTQASTERPRGGRYRQGKTLANRTFLIPSPKQNEPDGRTFARHAVGKLVSFIDRAVRQ